MSCCTGVLTSWDGSEHQSAASPRPLVLSGRCVSSPAPQYAHAVLLRWSTQAASNAKGQMLMMVCFRRSSGRRSRNFARASPMAFPKRKCHAGRLVLLQVRDARTSVRRRGRGGLKRMTHPTCEPHSAPAAESEAPRSAPSAIAPAPHCRGCSTTCRAKTLEKLMRSREHQGA